MIPVDAPRRAATGYGGGRAPASANEPPTSIPRTHRDRRGRHRAAQRANEPPTSIPRTPAAAPGRTSPAPRVPTSRPRRGPGRRMDRKGKSSALPPCQRAAHVDAQDAPRQVRPCGSRTSTKWSPHVDAQDAPRQVRHRPPRRRPGRSPHVDAQDAPRQVRRRKSSRLRPGSPRQPGRRRPRTSTRLDPQPRAAPGDSSRRRHAPGMGRGDEPMTDVPRRGAIEALPRAGTSPPL